jgi:hypothetical protein
MYSVNPQPATLNPGAQEHYGGGSSLRNKKDKNPGASSFGALSFFFLLSKALRLQYSALGLSSWRKCVYEEFGG